MVSRELKVRLAVKVHKVKLVKRENKGFVVK